MENTSAERIWAALRVPSDLLANFIAVFARFEYSLKRNRYLSTRVGDPAQPNWDGFAADLRMQCAPAELTALIRSAGYLSAYPTRKQIVGDDLSLAWTEPRPPIDDITQLLVAVRTTRNNLLHGGKFPAPAGPVAEPLRDERLVRDCLRVLEMCLDLDCQSSRDLRATFWDLDSAS
jgi:hypothetical protein